MTIIQLSNKNQKKRLYSNKVALEFISRKNDERGLIV